MKVVGKFEKVTFDEFYNAWQKVKEDWEKQNIPEDPKYFSMEYLEERYNELKLPNRATTGSKGYDIRTPLGFFLEPGEDITIPTGIRVLINEDGWGLEIVPKSGSGSKYFLRLANTIGEIDQDYSKSDNQGHIFARVRNEGKERFSIEPNKAFCQGIFREFGITEDDDVEAIRNGGFGSTNA